jgi:fatty-acyl-CoA synthase
MAEALPVKVMRDVVDKLHMTQISIVYGQTEASPGCTQSRVDDPLDGAREHRRARAAGDPCKIVDPVTGEDLPDNVDGRICSQRVQHHEGLLQNARGNRSRH